MSDAAGLLAALQLADSALPIGRFVHSHGLEAWLRDRNGAGAEDLEALVAVVVREAVAPLDGIVLAHAHRATTLAELLALDERLSARKLIPSARAASQSPGRQLAALAPALVGDPLVAAFAARVVSRETDGNLAVVEGALAHACGIETRDAVLLELRGVAAGLLAAAVRLGRASPTGAQAALMRMRGALADAAEEALAAGLDELSSTAPELEAHALAHARAETRFFST